MHLATSIPDALAHMPSLVFDIPPMSYDDTMTTRWGFQLVIQALIR